MPPKCVPVHTMTWHQPSSFSDQMKLIWNSGYSKKVMEGKHGCRRNKGNVLFVMHMGRTLGIKWNPGENPFGVAITYLAIRPPIIPAISVCIYFYREVCLLPFFLYWWVAFINRLCQKWHFASTSGFRDL